MKKVFLIFAALVCASAFSAPFAHAQSLAQPVVGGGGGFGGTVVNATFASNDGKGDLIVIVATAQSTTITASASNACEDSFTATPNSPTRGTTTSTWIFYAISSGGCTTQQVNFSGGSTQNDIWAADYLNMNQSTPFDCDVGGDGTGTALASGSCTTRFGSESAAATASASGAWSFMFAAFEVNNTTQDLLIGTGVTIASATFTAGSSYTVRAQVSHTGTYSDMFEDQTIGVAPCTLSPSSASVNQGATQTFSCVGGAPGTWACPGCQGSVGASTGTYIAPPSVVNQQSAGGFPMFGNSHVFNVNIASLPVDSSSASWISTISSFTLQYFPSFPANYCNGSTPTQSMVFFYTSPNNGTYEVVAYPSLRLETGVLSATTYNPFNTDHHYVCVDTGTGKVTEFYQYYPAGMNSSCLTCTSQAGLSYLASTFALPANGSTDAAGMPLWPLTLRLQELEQAVATGGTINHAIRFTLPNNRICDSSIAHACGENTTGNRHIWPATTDTNSGGGLIPYGARMRLKASINCATTFPGNAIAQVICVQLQQYGLIVADGGLSGVIQPTVEYTRMPLAYAQAFQAVNNAFTGTNFEFVNEQGIAVSLSSGATTVNPETVTFTRTSDGAVSTANITLAGPAVTLPEDVRYIQAGTAQQTFSAFVNFGAITWSMSPTVGTLNASTGAYTPPATVASPTSTVVTATSAYNDTPTGTTYYLSPTGNDSNSGTSSGSPWLTPNHPVNCGDVIIAAASSSYSAANFGSGKWGTVSNCGAANNASAAALQCATFDACKISTGSSDGMRVSASYWAVYGWEATTTSGGGACFSARPPTSSTTIHHIIFANDIANGCQQGGIITFNNGAASVDYPAIVGNIVYNAAQNGTVCYSGISIYTPQPSDTNAGTHILVSGNFSYLNVDADPCNGGTPTDGEGIIFDDFDASQISGTAYTQQAVANNNILVANGGRGFQAYQNKTGSSAAPIYAEHNTNWGNNTDTNQSATFCGDMTISEAFNVTFLFDIGATNGATGCGSNPKFGVYVGGSNGTSTVDHSWWYSAAGNNEGLNSSPGFSYGSSNTTGTNPAFSNATAPSAPSCGSATSVPNCMATVMSNFTATAGGASANGYQTPSLTPVADPLFPLWLCNVNLPAGLVSMGCLDSSVAASMTVVILPTGVIRMVPGQPSNYTDTHGNTWFAGALAGGDGANDFGTLSAYGYNNGGSWPSTPDITLYEISEYTSNDLRYDITVPNGNYQIDAKIANNSPSDLGNFVIEAQGVAGSPIDPYSLVGSNEPLDETVNATVTNGVLSFVLRSVNTQGAGVAPFLAAISISPNLSPNTPAAPPKKGLLLVSQPGP
jgi:hypothetical protein